jgi:hypothetical protein
MSNFCLQTNINSYIIKIYSPSVERTMTKHELYGPCGSHHFILNTNFSHKCFWYSVPYSNKNFFFTTCLRDISTHIVTAQEAGQPRNCGLIPGMARDFPILQGIQTICGVHTAFHLIGTTGSFPRQKAAEAPSRPLTSTCC